MHYIFYTLLAILFYALLLVPVLLIIVPLHLYVLNGMQQYQAKRVILFVLLVILVTPLQLGSDKGALFDMPIPRPSYTFLVDALYAGGFDIVITAITSNVIFSIFGVAASLVVCSYLSMKAYPKR